jgi:hypothetical protein
MGDPGDYVERIKAFPPDWWKMESVACTLAKCFAQHLVAIEVAFLSDGTPAHDFYTGFLLRWGPLDLWVTAGHVVARIRELLANPKVRILRAGLLDGYETLLYRADPRRPVPVSPVWHPERLVAVQPCHPSRADLAS